MLIADGGGGSVYRLHPPGGGVLPAPKPTPRPHSLDAGPRPTLGSPQVDPRILRAEGISRAQLMQQQAAAHQKEAVAEQQRAQQARQRADESQQQAEVAAARAREHGSKENKALATQWGKQARDDELNALRCEADANFTGKQAALEKSKLKDMQEGHASEPSRETQAAQVDADSAASTVSLLYDTPAGEADPLKAAGHTTHQLAKAEKWGEWQDATQQELRIAGLRALAKGEDPQAAMREHAKAIERRDVDGMVFTSTGDKGKQSRITGEDWVQGLCDGVRAEDPAQAALNAEKAVAHKAWQPLLDAAEKKADKADSQVAADKKALTEAPGGLKRDYQDALSTSRQAAGEAGENLHWWESRAEVAGNGYQQRQADQDVHRTEVGYQVAQAVGDPKNAKDQTAIADTRDARDRALGDQVLVRSHGKLLAADVDAQGAKKDLKDAWGAYADASTGQVQARTVTYKGRGGENTQTVYPEGYDKTFWAVPGSDEGKHVQLGDDGKYYYVSTSRGGHRGDVVETGREALNPVTAQVWAAYDKVHGRKENGPAQDGTLARQQQARDDYQSTNALLGSSSNGPGKLDPVFWERRSGEIEGDLSRAKADVAQAERAISDAQTYSGGQAPCDTLIANLGEKVKLRDQAQQQADALHAVQRWRASPGDKTLLDAAGQAVAKAGPAPDFSKSPLEGLRTDLSKAQDDKTAQQKIAAQPGDKQQAALDKISGLDLRIEHDQNLIAQAEAANQRSGALYLNSKFSFGDQAIKADGDVRFAMREDADGHSIGLDAAPPLNYEQLMAGATDDGEAKVLGDSGIRILHDTLGLKDVWEVPLAQGMKQYIYQRDGQVFTTRTLADPGVRLSAQTEELWQRLWKADAGQDKADQAVATSTTSLDHWNQLNPADPIAAPGAPAPAAPLPAPPGLDGKPVKVPTLWDSDLGQRRDTLIAQLHALQGSPEAGEMLEASGMQQAELDAVSAMKAAQDAHRALQQWQADPGQDCVKGVELRKAVSDAEDQAIAKKDKWLALCRSHGLESAKDARSTAQTRHQEWKNSHPALVGTEAERRTDSWAALQQAEGTFSGLEQQHIQAATPAAQAAQKALIDQNLSFDERQDPAKLHELFMQHPEVMAQALINEHYLQYGSGPLQMEGRTHLNNVVDGALGFQPDNPGGSGMPQVDEQGQRHTDQYRHLSDGQKASRDAVADEIEGIGGEQARVTLLPVVYSTRQSGVVKTTLFKVEDGHGGAKYVDERGARYKDLDDYRANNELPSTDCNIVLPASDKVELDSLGNVKLQVRDGRTETGWETFKRRSHFDTIVGGASVVLGVVMTVGSGGMLAPVAAGLLVAASAYGATTSVMSLSNRASHGLSINPFTDREARLDWLNLAGSALAVPTLSAATRAGMVAWQATRAAKAAGAIKTSMPWLAIRGSKQTGEALAKMASVEGPAGARAAAMQNKIEFWSTPGQVMAKPTMVAGGLGMEENTRYMADNWSAMSSDQRWEQGGMTLLNLVDFSSPVLARGVQAGRQALGHPAGSEPVAPVPAREPTPVPDADTQTFGSLPDAPLSAAAAEGPYQVGAVRKTGAPVINAKGEEVAYIRQDVLGLRFVDKDGVDLPPHLVDELQRNGPLWPGGEPAQQPPTVRTTRVPLGPDGAPVNHVHLSEGGIVFKEGPYQKKVKARELSADEVNAWLEASRTQGADTIAKVLNSTAGMQIGSGPAKGIAVLDLPSDARVLLAQSIRTGRGGTAAGAGGAPVAVAFASGEQRRIGLVAPLTRHAAPGPAEVGRYIPRRASPKPDQVGPPRLWEAEHAFFEAAGRALHAHARQQGVAPAKIEGSINVYVDRSICDSCKSVSAQFQREFPGIRVSVKSTGPDEGGGHHAEPAGGPTPSDPTPGDPAPAISPERLSPPRRQGARPLPLSTREQGPGVQDRQLPMDPIRPASQKPGAEGGETSRPSRVARDEEPAADAPADGPAGSPPARLVRVGWRRTLAAVDDVFRARFGEHLDDRMPAAGDRYRFIFGKRRFFKQASSDQLTAPNARQFARDYLAVTRTPPKGASNPFPQVFHRISLTQSPRRVVETIAHELAHAYQSRDYESIGHKYLGDVLAEGGADLVVRRLLGRPLKNAAYGKEERLLQDAIGSLGKKGEAVFLDAFFKGDAGAVQKLHTALRTEYGKLPDAERAALEKAATPDPAAARARAQAEPSSPAEGPARPMPAAALPVHSPAAGDHSRERFAVVEGDPATLASRGEGKNKGAVPANRHNTFKSFEEAAQAAGERGGAWVYRLSPDPSRMTLALRGRADASEVMGFLRIGHDGAVAADRADLLAGSESATRAEVHQLLEASLHGKGNPTRERELIEDALWVKQCMPSEDGSRRGSIVSRPHVDDGRVSAWTRMSADQRQAAEARANIVLQDLVGPDWTQAVSLRRDKGAPANVLRFSDIHLHLGGRSNGYGVNNPLGPRIEQMFLRSGERRGAQVQDVMVFPVPDATTRTPYYMMNDGNGGIMKLELQRQGNELVFVGSDVNWPKGRVSLPSGHRFQEGAVTHLNDGEIEWLTRQAGDGSAVQYAEAYVVPKRGLSWRGLKRSEATMQEVLKLPEDLASRVKIGLIGGQMAHPDGALHVLQELAVANRLDPSGTKLHIVGGGELTGIKEGVAINHLHQIDLGQPGNGLDSQLHLYDKAGGLVVVHFDADNPSYLKIPGGGHLLVSKTSGTQNLDALYATFSKYPKATIVHAHWGGLSRSAGPSEAHANKIRELLTSTPNVCIDTSWDAAGRRIFQDPHLSKVYAKLIDDFPGRFISGSDEVAQMDNFKGAVRLQQESGFARLLDDPDALYTGNFARIVGQAQAHMGGFRRANSGLLVPETLAQLREPVATTLGRLKPFDHGLPRPGELPAQEQVTLTGPGARLPGHGEPEGPADAVDPGTARAARRSPPSGNGRYIAGLGVTAVSALGVHLLASKTGLALGDPAITNPLAFTLRGLLIGAKTRLTGRIEMRVGKLGADPVANAPVLDRLERLLVKRGALIGIRKDDRALIQRAISEVRRDPLDPAGLATLKDAKGKVLSPRTAAGLADVLTRHVTFAYNLGNATASLSHEGWFRPADAAYWSTTGFGVANLLLSTNNFNTMASGLHRVAAGGQAKMVKVGQAAAMTGFSLAAGAWAVHNFDLTPGGIARSSLDVAFGVGAALQAHNDIRAVYGKDAATYGKLPHPLMILASSLVAREGFDINNYF